MSIMVSAVWALALGVGLAESETRWQAQEPAGKAAPAGYQTFVSSRLGVAVDYPEGWTASEQPSGATFKSPEGMPVHLMPIEQETAGDQPGNDMPEWLPNTRCSTSTNAHGITALVCLDTISRTYTAGFAVKPPGEGASRRFSLSAGLRVGHAIFSAMLASIRPAP